MENSMNPAKPTDTTSLFPPALPRDALHSPAFRLEPVVGDGMEPTLRPDDWVLVRPVNAYDGEGLYLITNPFGGWEIYCAASAFTKTPSIRLFRDNKHYTDRLVGMSRSMLEKGGRRCSP
jgi:hypothetical protein